jgi:hypothetical protein
MRSPSFTTASLVLASVLLALAGPGCAAETASAPSPDPGEVDELNASSLREATAFEGSVAAGGTITLHYEQTSQRYARAIPYIAVEIVAPPTTHTAGLHALSGGIGAMQRITVTGEFPSAPRVLLVDDSFKVLAQQTAETQPSGSQIAVLQSPPQVGRRFVLTRDPRWSKPMSFQVQVGQ